MNNTIESCTLMTTEKVYHLRIKHNNEEFFYIVNTLDLHYKDDISTIVSEIRRGVTYWDCGKMLKNSERKKIKSVIEKYFEELNNNNP